MTTPQAATLLGVSTRTIQRWCRSGMIVATDWRGVGTRHRRWISGEALLTALSRWYHIRAVVKLGRAYRVIRAMQDAINTPLFNDAAAQEHTHGD